MHNYSFSKNERLKHKKLIDQLFENGQSKVFYPIILFWLEQDKGVENIPVQFTTSVSKKKFKSAVDRNKIKRRMREAYRLSKPDFFDSICTETTLSLMSIYIAPQISDFQTIEKAIQKGIKYLTKQYG